jgi:hypothetical protein
MLVSRMLFAPFAPAIVFNLATFVVFLIGAHQGRLPDMIVSIMANYSSLILTIAGIEADARRRQQTPCFDFGWIYGMYLPFSALWYCFRSRGWRGIFLLAGLCLLWITPAVSAVVAMNLAGLPLDQFG